jgi:hypothetical protein
MVNYQNGKIYEIINDETEEKYIGSTTVLLCKRMTNHRSNYKKYLKSGGKYITSYNILKYDSAKIVLIEDYPCNSKEELFARERHWINISKCVNKNLPCRTNKEWREDNKEKIKENQKKYRENNKQKAKETHKKYYQDNKEKLKEYNKEYWEDNKEKIKEWRENNKEKIKEYKKKYYEDNKEKIKEEKRKKITCECGSEITLRCLARHKKSQKHINLMKIKNQ